jgi:hypothetical protein
MTFRQAFVGRDIQGSFLSLKTAGMGFRSHSALFTCAGAMEKNNRQGSHSLGHHPDWCG